LTAEVKNIVRAAFAAKSVVLPTPLKYPEQDSCRIGDAVVPSLAELRNPMAAMIESAAF
jgi:hypothetical protein